MSRPLRLALALAGVTLAVVLFVVFRPDDDERTTQPTDATTTSTVATTTAPVTTTTTVPAPKVTNVRITFRRGAVVGGIRQARVRKGDRVRLVVRADIADEVHLHGYDVIRRVRPGLPTLLVFRATAVGRFEVELEQRHIPLAEIEVRP